MIIVSCLRWAALLAVAIFVMGQTLVSTAQEFSGNIINMEWSPNDQLLAVAGRSGVAIYSNELNPVIISQELVSDIAWSPDGNKLAFLTYPATFTALIEIWDVEDLQNVQQIMTIVDNQVPDDAIFIDWNPVSNYLAVSGEGIRIWNTDTGVLAQVFPQVSWFGFAVKWNPDGTQLASADFDHKVRVWDFESGNLLRVIPSTDYIPAVAWSPDGSSIAVTVENNIEIWEIESLQTQPTIVLQGHTDDIYLLDWSNNVLVSSGRDGNIRIWNMKTTKVVEVLPSIDGSISRIALSHDGAYLAYGTSVDTLQIIPLSSMFEVPEP